VTDNSVDAILYALRDWMEAHADLEERRGEYSGDSPSYALGHWYEVEQAAQNRARAALSDFIAVEVERQLAVKP